jgi:purine-binding chemotaxis protein CheW
MSDVAIASPEQKLVRFQLGDENFAFSVKGVTGIIRWREITPLPHVAPHVLGLANLRGRTMPVSDLRIQLGLTPAVSQEDSYIIVTESEFGQIGLLVDSVAEVISITDEDIQEQVSDTDSNFSGVSLGIVNRDDKLISILDVDRLLGVTE